MSSTSTAARLSNRILAGLPASDREAVLAAATPVTLEFGKPIYGDGEPIDAAYFPDRGVISMVNTMADGTTIEVGTIGREGVAGLGLFLGVSSVAGHTFVQVPGDGWKIEADTFRELLKTGGPLAARLGRYTQALFTQVAQSAACNRAHPVEQRCARWLLMVHDLVGEADLPLTQELLAIMLGVRRPTITMVLGSLRRAGLVAERRGHTRIVDRGRLHAISCECYRVMRTDQLRLLEY